MRIRDSGFGNLTGPAQGDRLAGDAGNNVTDGGAGNGTLTGGGGEDNLLGGTGDDNPLNGAEVEIADLYSDGTVSRLWLNTSGGDLTRMSSARSMRPRKSGTRISIFIAGL